MNVERIGLILYVIKYEECVHFYQNILKLSILFQNDELTSFDLFGTYLMIEREDRQEYLEDKSDIKNHSCIRINVNDVRYYANELTNQNVMVDYQEHSWGKVAKFKDPEGNLIAFKDEDGFAKQIEDYNS